jgi:hypothetical protein
MTWGMRAEFALMAVLLAVVVVWPRCRPPASTARLDLEVVLIELGIIAGWLAWAILSLWIA